MIVRQFLAATQHPSAGRRAEAASALGLTSGQTMRSILLRALGGSQDPGPADLIAVAARPMTSPTWWPTTAHIASTSPDGRTSTPPNAARGSRLAVVV